MTRRILQKMTPRIIAVIGFKRAGKDTIAAHLAQVHGYAVLKFATPLKIATKALFGFTDEQVEHCKDVVDPAWGVTPRHVMQVLGTDIVQYKLPDFIPGLGRDLFVRTLLQRADALGDDARIVVSDMRFNHECAALKKRFPGQVFVIRVVRNHHGDRDAHESEREHLKIHADLCIENDESIGALHAKVDNVMRRFYA